MSIKEEDLKDPVYWLRWSINAGLVTDVVKDTLYSYGYLSHKDVKASDVAIDISIKKVHYILFVPKKTLKAYTKYHDLIESSGIIDLWRAKRLLRKHGNLDIHRILQDFVSRLCGHGWTTTMDVKAEEEFVENAGEETA
jgi:hypothetical protein